jgi:anti-anti-sigma factor
MITINKLDNNIDQVTFNNLEKFNALVADEVRNELKTLFEAPNSRVVIDLVGIKYIDSSGFGCFLATMKTARNNYGTLKLCNIIPDIKSMFMSLQLHTVFELYDDLESCLSSFR